MENLKRCCRCGERKERELFYCNKSAKDGLSQMCRICHSSYSSERRRIRAMDRVAEERFVPFGNLVLAARQVKGLTQEGVGELVGVTGTQVRLWEKGKAYPRQRQREQLCAVLEIDLPLSLKQNESGLIPYGVKDCAICGKKFPVYKKGVSHCSRACSGKAQSIRQAGEGSPSWRGGRYINAGSGYVNVRVPGSPNAGSRGYILEHRYVMSQILGRPLGKLERVHHKNGDRADNRPDNLELWTVEKKDPAGQRTLDLIKDLATRLSAEERQGLALWLKGLL